MGERPEESARERGRASPHVVGAGGQRQARRQLQERVALDEQRVRRKEGVLGVRNRLCEDCTAGDAAEVADDAPGTLQGGQIFRGEGMREMKELGHRVSIHKSTDREVLDETNDLLTQQGIVVVEGANAVWLSRECPST